MAAAQLIGSERLAVPGARVWELTTMGWASGFWSGIRWTTTLAPAPLKAHGMAESPFRFSVIVPVLPALSPSRTVAICRELSSAATASVELPSDTAARLPVTSA